MGNHRDTMGHLSVFRPKDCLHAGPICRIGRFPIGKPWIPHDIGNGLVLGLLGINLEVTRPGKLTLCDIEAMAIEIVELPIKNGDFP